MQLGTVSVDGHDTVFAARRAKWHVIRDEFGFEFVEADFPGGGVYRDGILVWDPAKQSFRAMTEKEYKACMQKLFDPENYLRYMEPMQAAEDALIDLSHRCDEIVLVTSAYGAVRETVEELILLYDLPIRSVITTHGDKNAKRECYANSDLVIDNEPEHLGGLDRYGTRPILLLPSEGELGWRAAYRETAGFHDVLPTARGWGNVVDLAFPQQLAA